MVIKKKAGRISPVFMGDYDNTTIYRRLDWVYYGGTSYICKKNNTTGIVPSDIEKWQKIIELPTELDMIFEEAATRENIASGDKLSVVLGKIKKWYSDLKKVAFTGKFEDLVEKPGVVTKTENGLVQKGDGQANKVWKTDANGNPGWRDDANTQAVTSVNNKTGAITLSAKDVRAVPANNRIEKLTDINEITSIGFWAIGAIDPNYATSIGIDNNTGDFYALVLSYNGNSTNIFNFGTVILSSPRISTYHYEIQVWEGVAQAIKTLNNKNILNTTEQISANTNNINLAGALALKAAIADYTNKISAINSNLVAVNAARWGDVQPNTNIVIQSSIQWNTWGSICFVYVYAHIKIDNKYTDYVLATGLPYAKFGYTPLGVVIDQDTNKHFTIYVKDRTKLVIGSNINAPFEGHIRGFVGYCFNQT